jgi:hypothetical protein
MLKLARQQTPLRDQKMAVSYELASQFFERQRLEKRSSHFSHSFEKELEVGAHLRPNTRATFSRLRPPK